MTEKQWELLVDIINGKKTKSDHAAFIIDSPWLPGWYGISTLDYYTSDHHWFEANKKAIETFSDVIFLPGFWSEYGMCTEPSAFGAKLVWSATNLPHAERVLSDLDGVQSMKTPDARNDGLLPFTIQRLVHTEDRIKRMGHSVKFAVSRGPLNIASFLMGTTEFMMAIAMQPDETHKLIEIITDFTIQWIEIQIEKFPSIDGILLLDDLVGFLGEDEFKAFALPYLKRIYSYFDASINFFHNDAQGLICAPYLKEIGVNLFNFSHEHSLSEIRQLAGNEVALLGNIPPRDVMGLGATEDVKRTLTESYHSITDKSGILWSCGGGMPQSVSTENIHAFTETLKSLG